MNLSFVRCLLCQGAIPAKWSEDVEIHFQIQHKVYFNIDFLFKSSFLSDNELSRTMEFIVSLFTLEDADPSVDEDINGEDEDLSMDEVISDEDKSKENTLDVQEVETETENSNISFGQQSNPGIVESKTFYLGETVVKCISRNGEENERPIITTFKPESITSTKSLNSFPIATLKSDVLKSESGESILTSERALKEEKVDLFSCSLCDKKFTKRKSLQTHKVDCRDRITIRKCKVCQKECLGKILKI